MELAALFVVNLVTAIVMYIFFSLRYSRAIQNRDQGIVDTMRSIAEETQRASLEILEIVQQKQKSIYLLVRRAEELQTAFLEMDSQTITKPVATKSRQAPQKKVSKKISSKKKAFKKKSENTKTDNKTPSPPKSMYGLYTDDTDHLIEESDVKSDKDAYIGRVLAKMSSDQYDIQELPPNAQEAYNKGRLTQKYPTQNVSNPAKNLPEQATQSHDPDLNQNQQRAETGVLAGLGRMIKKLMGAESSLETQIQARQSHSSTSTGPDAHEQPPQMDFGTILETTIKKSNPPELLPGFDKWIPSASVKPDTFDRLDFSDQNMASYEDDIKPLYNSTPKIGKERKKMNPDQNELADQDSTLLAPGSGRAARIRQMLDAGYTIDEVQSATGYSYTEIDLVMKLPKSRKPDRYKKPV